MHMHTRNGLQHCDQLQPSLDIRSWYETKQDSLLSQRAFRYSK